MYGPKLEEVGRYQGKVQYEEFHGVSGVLTAVVMQFCLVGYNVL
jgi:hypothetical protein